MEKLISLYTTTSGRIGRKDWWIGAIILGVIIGVINGIITPIAGGNVSMVFILQAVVAAVFAFPLYALGVKRRHDRNSNGLDALVLVAANIVVPLVSLVIPSLQLLMIVSAVFGLFALYMLVMLGFLKGDAGPNQYGADPVA